MTDGSWYYVHQGTRHGPVSFAEIKTLAAAGRLSAEDQVWREGMADWAPAGNVPELRGVLPPPPPAAAPAAHPNVSLNAILVAVAVVAVVALGWKLSQRRDPPTGEAAGGGHTSRDDKGSAENGLSLEELEQTRQKETVTRLRSLGNAYMSWLTDQVGAASAGARKFYVSDYGRRLSRDEVMAELRPSDTFYYAVEVELDDGWGHPLEVWRGDNLLMSQVIMIRSPGRDGTFDGEEYDGVPFAATDYDRDIVWADGYFIRYPEGIGR